MFSIKEEQNTSYFVLRPFKFVFTSVKFQMSGHYDKHSRNGVFPRLSDVCVHVHTGVLFLCSPGYPGHSWLWRPDLTARFPGDLAFLFYVPLVCMPPFSGVFP